MRKSKLPFFILIIFLIFISILILNYFKKDIPLISPSPAVTPLQKVVGKAMEGIKGTYTIVIKNLKTGENYFQNEDKAYEAGSLYKLWVMAAVYDKINKGELQEDQTLSQDIAVLNQEFGISEDETELTDGKITLSVTDALHQMIVISHNFAALLLTENITNSRISKYLEENGFLNSKLGTPPKTTAGDIALFFEKLYHGELVSKEYSERMINLLKEQKLNDGLPKYLPDKSKVANKTGDIGWFKHDAGIVFTDKGDFIIAILSESDYPAGAQERIALVSKAAYDYFTK